ncbi:histidine kinase [Micromonospora sp. NPDC005220]|uniref:sensor histidine kinase n=1 Tax=Micromonospora sp. NPDC005220 TaxID=3155589 RepID=UPI0033B78A2C
MAMPDRVVASVFWTSPAVVALVVGGYPRLMARQRVAEVEQARRAQRLKLARDLHDFVAHDISGIIGQAQAARFVADSRPDAAGPALARIEATGLAALTTMDRVIRMLHESNDRAVEPPPTLDDLPAVIERFRAGGHIDARLVQTARTRDVPQHAAATAYRVAVEALTNVRRHAPTATHVDVSVTGNASGVQVRVCNDMAETSHPPTHPRATESGGNGLQGLRELIVNGGGTLSAGPCERG